MKRISASVYLLISVALLACWSASAQEKVVKKVPARPTTATSGKDLFRQYCAVCHGVDGKGGGPAADALKKTPVDLTQISKRNGGRFPEQKILAILRGEGTSAHGSADMPIWGPIFSAMSSDPNQGQARIHAVLNFLEEMQAK